MEIVATILLIGIILFFFIIFKAIKHLIAYNAEQKAKYQQMYNNNNNQ